MAEVGIGIEIMREAAVVIRRGTTNADTNEPVRHRARVRNKRRRRVRT